MSWTVAPAAIVVPPVLVIVIDFPVTAVLIVPSIPLVMAAGVASGTNVGGGVVSFLFPLSSPNNEPCSHAPELTRGISSNSSKGSWEFYDDLSIVR